jgi:hypothetical protein
MPVRPSHYHIYGHPYLPYNLIPSSIVGIPGYPVQNITLNNIEIIYGGRSSKEIAYIPLQNIGLIPENEAQYPEFSMFGELPAWGFYIRHAEGIKMTNIKLSYKEADYRPAMVMDDVKNIQLNQVAIPTVKELPVFYFQNATGIDLKKITMPVPEEKAIIINNKN